MGLLTEFYSLYAHQHKSKIVLLSLGAILAGVIEVAGLVSLYLVIKLLVSINSLGSHHFLIKLFEKMGLTARGEMISFLAIIVVFIFIFKNIYILLYYMAQHKVLRKWKTDLSMSLMEGYINAPYVRILQYNSSTIIRNINNSVSQAIDGFILSVFNVYANTVVAIIILGLVYLKYFFITFFVGGVITVAAIVQNHFIKRKSKQLGEVRDKLLAEKNKSVYQGIHAIKETKVLGKEHFFIGAFANINEQATFNSSQSLFLNRMPKHISEIIIIVAIIMLCAFILNDTFENIEMSVASLGVLAAIAFRIAPLLNRTVVALQKINKNINSIKTVLNEYKSFQRNKKDGDPTALEFKNSLTFKNVSFSYPQEKEAALKNFNCSFQKGMKVGIVGASGSGKTTFADLLLGLLSPAEGSIEVDGQSIHHSLRSWQKMLNYVPQNVYLYDDSLAHNIAFGVEDQELEEEKIISCLKAVDLYDFFKEKKEGIFFKIGENGKHLSGGQKQRVGIARALYRECSLIVFDEATSALDAKTEKVITQNIKEINKDLTIFTIAHRLSTIHDSDLILYLEKGHLIGAGSFEELCASNESFYEMAKISKLIS